MSSFDRSWARRFAEGHTVQFLDGPDSVVQLGEVFTLGDDYMHFLVSPEDPLFDRLKFDNRIQVRSLKTHRTVEGTLSLLDHRPGFFERSVRDVSGKNPEKRLVKFQPADVDEPGEEAVFDRLSPWPEVLHFRSLPATIVPILLGLFYAALVGWPISAWASVLALTGGILVHLASNLHNELSEFHDALLRNQPVEGNPINEHSLNPGLVWSVAIMLYGVATLAGLPLLWLRGGEFLAVGAVAFMIASFYSLHQHTSTNYAVARDLLMFVLMGPLMAVASAIAVSGHWNLQLVVVALPIGFFVALILHEHEIYSIPIDRRAGATTLAIVLGFKGSKLYYGLLIAAGYLVIGFLTVLDYIPVWTLMTYLSLPYALYNLRLLREIESPLHPRMAQLRRSTAVLQAMFGVFYLAGFLTEVYF